MCIVHSSTSSTLSLTYSINNSSIRIIKTLLVILIVLYISKLKVSQVRQGVTHIYASSLHPCNYLDGMDLVYCIPPSGHMD